MHKIYLVGGSVRDSLMGIKSKDKDYVVEASFAELRDFLKEKNYEILLEKEEFLTMRVKIPDKSVVDFACCRHEANHNGRFPETVVTTTLEGDLSRRDFTVNAMAIEVDPDTFEPIGEIIDLFGGQEDLKLGILRFVGNPVDRLTEDGLRWLRAIRFWITKDLKPTGDTFSALFNCETDYFKKVSPERIKDELNMCLKYDTIKTLEILATTPKFWCKDNLWLKATLEER